MEVETTLTSTRYLLVLFLSLSLVGTVAGSHLSHDSGSSISTETDFTIPEFDSHEEIIFNLVLPFIFVFAILNFIMEKALLFTFANDDEWEALREKDSEKKRVKKYGTLISLTVTGMLVPSPLWDYVILAGHFLSTVGVFAFVLLFLFIIYLASGIGR